MHPYSESLSKSREDLVTASKLASQLTLASYKRYRQHGSSPNLYYEHSDTIRKSVACIQDELNNLGLAPPKLPYKPDIISHHHNHHHQHELQMSDSSAENSCRHRWPPTGGSFTHSEKPIGWMYGLLGCMKPVLSFIGKAGVIEIKNQKAEDWEIPFEAITDLHWLGSGAQGAVFSGRLKNETVAVKKVKDVKETDIKHLRKLDHENIIKFKGVKDGSQ